MPATAPVNEIGYAQQVNYNWWLYESETTPELIWPQSVFVFDQMRRTDSQVASVLRAVTLPVRRTPWRIDPAGARARVVKFVADDLGLPIVGKQPTVAPRLKDRFSWPEHLRQALLMLVFGHMYFEIVYRVDEGGTAAHLRKLAPRPPKTIERVDVAPDGGLVAIRQYWTSTTEQPKPIPVDRLVAYVHDREGGNWLGNSLLRPAYKHWLIKDRLLRVQAQTIERNGMGIPLYKAQDGASTDDLAAGKSMATAWRAGEAAGSAVPFGADLVLRGVEGTLPDAQPAIDYHDSQIARAVLAHFLNLGTQTGSWALGTTFADFFTLSLQTLAQQIADTATQHIIEDLVDANFGENEPAPRLVFDEIGSRQAATAEALKSLVDAGIVHPDQVLEETSRQQYGLPPADPATATAPPQPAAPTAPPEPPTPTGAMSVAAKFNPTEPREPHSGKWVGHGGGTGVKDALNLAGRIQLGDSEHFAGSAKVKDANGDLTAVLAGVDGPSGRQVRLGLVQADDASRWRAADKGGTVVLDHASATKLREVIVQARERGGPSVAEYKAAVRAAHGKGLPESQWPDPEASIASGVIGAGWGDLHWSISREYGSGGINIDGTEYPAAKWVLGLSVDAPGGVPMDQFDLDSPGALQKLDGALVGLMGAPGEVQAAAGIDTHPGGEQLKHYWLYGEGAAKWSTWTELYHHLVKYLNPEMAKRTAAAWFHLRYGDWPGSDTNRVRHGKHPRGNVVGPG